jgi:hypothetical protein
MPVRNNSIVPESLSRLPARGTVPNPTNSPRQNLSDFKSPLPHAGSDPINDSIFSDDLTDLVDFKIRDVVNDKTLQFRCTVSNITESGTPSWNQIDYIGRPYPIWVYKGVTRTLTFDFRVYPNNRRELPVVWNKINYLSGLIHPSAYTVGGYMVPPYIEFTLGNLFKGQLGFISSYNNTISPESSWEVQENHKLPFIADINLSINIIENELKTPFKNLYGFDVVYAPPESSGFTKVVPKKTQHLPSNLPKVPTHL